MNKNRFFVFCLFVVFSMSARAENVIIARTGVYDLSETRQTSVDSPFQTEYVFDDARNLWGIEYEHRLRNNISLGVEYFEFENEYTTIRTMISPFPVGSTAGIGGVLGTFALTFNVKKYFQPTRWLLPYVGLGAGLAGGVLQPAGSTIENQDALTGLAAQGVAGMEFRFGRVGLHTQAKVLSASLSGDVDLDASGVGYFAGLGIHF